MPNGGGKKSELFPFLFFFKYHFFPGPSLEDVFCFIVSCPLTPNRNSTLGILNFDKEKNNFMESMELSFSPVYTSQCICMCINTVISSYRNVNESLIVNNINLNPEFTGAGGK